MPAEDERPKWSVTWLFRIQRIGRKEPRPASEKSGTGFQWFSWIVLALLVVEVGILVWQGFLPR